MKAARTWCVALALVLASGAAFAADVPKPLRTLVYDVSYDALQTQEEKTSGFDAPGAPDVQQQFNVGDVGQLTVDVVAATADGGLVVDTAFAGKTRKDPPLRVAILRDGHLSWDPAKELAPEAIRILPFLARGLVAERAIAAGVSWVTRPPAPATGTLTYRIATLDKSIAHLDVQGIVSVPGPPTYDENSNDSTVYDLDHLMPISAEIVVTVRRRLSGVTTQSTRIHLVAKLASDTFANR
jgi:hypothetical protein